MARGQLRFATQGKPEAKDTVAEALAAFGLICEDDVVVDEDEFWLWPENEEAFWFWCSIQTQWMKDMERPVGLNYAGVESCMRMRGIPSKKRPALFGMIQAMENTALEEWAAKG